MTISLLPQNTLGDLSDIRLSASVALLRVRHARQRCGKLFYRQANAIHLVGLYPNTSACCRDGFVENAESGAQDRQSGQQRISNTNTTARKSYASKRA